MTAADDPMPDPHTALEAAITARLEVARAVAEQAGRFWYAAHYSELDEWRVRDRATQAPIADVIGGINAAAKLVSNFAAAHDPDDAVRRYERDLRVLKRHAPIAAPHLGAVLICAYEWADGDGWDVLWAEHPPIADLLDVYPEVRNEL